MISFIKQYPAPACGMTIKTAEKKLQATPYSPLMAEARGVPLECGRDAIACRRRMDMRTFYAAGQLTGGEWSSVWAASLL
jgi:hypothetical protein